MGHGTVTEEKRSLYERAAAAADAGEVTTPERRPTLRAEDVYVIDENITERAGFEGDYDIVVVDPARGFGKPLFANSGAPVEDVMDRMRSGEDIRSVIDDFALTADEIQWCYIEMFGLPQTSTSAEHLVDDLRLLAQILAGHKTMADVTMLDAADEIERLRADNERLLKAWRNMPPEDNGY
jgi:uncharacterized protein (DUF433 family)